MTEGQKKFYRFMHVLTIIGITGIFITSIALIAIWIIKPAGGSTSYSIELGVLSIQLPDDYIGTDFLFSNYYFLIGFLGQFLIFGVLLWNMKIFFKNLKNSQIFVIPNAKAIQNVGILLIITAFYSNIPALIATTNLLKYLENRTSNFSIQYGIDFDVLFGGLAVLAVAQIFKEAIRIKEENELTI